MYLGIDISKNTFDVTLLTESKQRNHKFQNTISGAKQLLEWLKDCAFSELHSCMEATGKYWELLAEMLHEAGIKVSVVNPAKIKGFSNSELRRSKTDKLDAQLIARYCRAMKPAVWSPPSPELRAVRDMRRHLDALVEHRTRVKNRLKSGRLNEVVEKSCMEELQFLDTQVANLEREIADGIETNAELKTKYDLLKSIPGVGPALAVAYLGEVSIGGLFTNSRELEVYVGIAPRHKESGTSLRARERISKVGNSRMRKSLYMPALSGVRFNPILRDFRDRLKQAGKSGRVIVCAVMRKLLRLMYGILKSGTPFDSMHVSRRPNNTATAV